MEIGNAELDEDTGCPIARGRIVLDRIDGRIIPQLPAHERVLLEFRRTIDFGLIVWPVTDLVQSDNGFCKTRKGALGLYFAGLTSLDIDRLRARDSQGNMMRGGPDCGGAVSGTGLLIRMLHKFRRFDCQAEHVSDGFCIVLRGNLVSDGDPEIQEGWEAYVEATMKWETLIVAGFRSAAPFWKYQAQGSKRPSGDVADRQRDPHKLQDILVCEGLTWPILQGSLALRSPVPSLGWRSRDIRFLIAQFEDRRVVFQDANRVEVLTNGFARSFASKCWITIDAFGREWLECRLLEKDRVSLTATGDGVGHISFCTGYSEDYGDPFGTIAQPIRSLTAVASVTVEGLDLEIEVELDDFDTAIIESHRRERNSTFQSIPGFVLRTLVPWSLLTARQFLLGRRPKNFFA